MTEVIEADVSTLDYTYRTSPITKKYSSLQKRFALQLISLRGLPK